MDVVDLASPHGASAGRLTHLYHDGGDISQCHVFFDVALKLGDDVVCKKSRHLLCFKAITLVAVVIAGTTQMHSMTNLVASLRGTNTTELEPEPDARGEDPWQDLWFYSNPVFVELL